MDQNRLDDFGEDYEIDSILEDERQENIEDDIDADQIDITHLTNSSNQQNLLVEFVMLCGPPCSGKTIYYKQKYAQRNYTRVCPAELFSDAPSLSLHKVVQIVLKHLSEGRNVVLDDTSQTSLERTRRSYLTAIKEKVPHCRCLAISFQTSISQCLWSREFALAERAVCYDEHNKTMQPIKFKEPEIEEWFLHKNLPTMAEGFTEIREVAPKLVVNFPTSFNIPSLMIDAKSIMKMEDDSFSLLKESNETIKEWKQLHPNGRVFVLVDESSLFPVTIELLRNEPLQQKKKNR